MRVSAPPFLHPCYYGTDVDSEDGLVACHYTVPEIARHIGADSLGYLPVEQLKNLVGNTGFCSACFSGEYPVEPPKASRKLKFETHLSEKE